MTLRGAFEEVLPHLPEEFTDADLDRWIPWLRRRYRHHSSIERRLMQVLAEFAERGKIRMVAPGSWEQLQSYDAEPTLSLPLRQGDVTNREELADIIGTDGPAPLQRGIFKRAEGPFRDQLLLFHNPHENPYGDVLEGETVHYVGQGQEGDQKLQGFNRYIAEHLKRGLTLHFFEKEGAGGDLRYRGEYVCESYQRVYRPDEKRSVLTFKLLPFDPHFAEAETTPLDYYQEARDEILQFAGEPRFVDRPARATVATRLVRNVAFRDTILDAYHEHCAVCGETITHGGLTELEAAHIVAVSERGPDDPRNGLALCARHHWAFDNGVFTLTEEWEVHSFLDGPDPHGELLHGEEILLPEREDRQPHPWYIRHHREKWMGSGGLA